MEMKFTMLFSAASFRRCSCMVALKTLLAAPQEQLGSTVETVLGCRQWVKLIRFSNPNMRPVDAEPWNRLSQVEKMSGNPFATDSEVWKTATSAPVTPTTPAQPPFSSSTSGAAFPTAFHDQTSTHASQPGLTAADAAPKPEEYSFAELNPTGSSRLPPQPSGFSRAGSTASTASHPQFGQPAYPGYGSQSATPRGKPGSLNALISSNPGGVLPITDKALCTGNTGHATPTIASQAASQQPFAGGQSHGWPSNGPGPAVPPQPGFPAFGDSQTSQDPFPAAFGQPSFSGTGMPAPSFLGVCLTRNFLHASIPRQCSRRVTAS